MSYPDLKNLFQNLETSKTISIMTVDSLIDSHSLFLTAYFINFHASRKKEDDVKIFFKSFRFRKFEIEAVLNKAGINGLPNLIKNGLLEIFDIGQELPESPSESADGSSTKTNVLILDGLTAILEQTPSDQSGLQKTLNLILKSEKLYQNVIFKLEVDKSIELENKIAKFLHKRSDIFIETEPTSFVSSSVHGKLVVDYPDEEMIYKRLYHVKDRSLKVMPLG